VHADTRQKLGLRQTTWHSKSQSPLRTVAILVIQKLVRAMLSSPLALAQSLSRLSYPPMRRLPVRQPAKIGAVIRS